jgi:poly-gamma-glutamate synthesis protein (capsule biosynthesis protein)
MTPRTSPAAVLIALAGLACSAAPSSHPTEIPPPAANVAVPAPAPEEKPPEPEPAEPPAPAFVPRDLPDGFLHFSSACDEGERITVAAVGDMLVHRELQRQALRSPDGFANIWAPIGDLLERADITYANLEGPAAWGISRKGEEVPDPGKKFDNVVYTGYARFNYHPSITEDIAKSGIDVVSTVNNHSLDRLALGVDRTLDALDKAGVEHFGTRRQKAKDAPWHAITTKGGFTLAWVGCTMHTNWQKDDQDMVFYCYERTKELVDMVERLSRSKDIDAVIVAPHFGREYERKPREKEVVLSRRLLDAGAIAVLASHPHVLQPWEKHVTPDGRETFVIYSLGNFCSHQRTLPRRSTMILYVGLTKGADDEVRINGVRYVPLHVRMEGKKHAFFVEAIDRVGGPADSRRLTVDMFGEYNLMHPDDDLVTNPQCDPGWEHHPK